VHEPRLPGTFTYGPYAMGGTVVVEVGSTSGSSVAWSETSSIYTKDSAGNVTGLVGPGGDPVRPWVLDSTPSAHQCLRSGASVVGWTLTNNSGGTGSMAMDLNSPLGGPALKVTITDDTGSVDLIATGLDVANFTAGRGKVVAHIYIQDELGIKQVRPYVGPSGLGRNMDRTYQISNSNKYRINGDHIIDIHPDNAAANTLLTTDTLDTVRLRINAQPAGGALWVGGIYIPDPEPEQWLIVTFDDADVSLYSRLYPLMAERGHKFTLGVNYDQVGTNDTLYVTFANLATMYTYGADITSHNRTNTAYPDETPPIAQPSDADRLTYCTEFRYARQKYIDLGYTRAMGYHPYVQGAYDGALTDAMRAHGGRLFRPAANDKNVEPFLMNKQSILNQRALGSGSSLAAAQGWIDQAVTRKQDVCVMGHILAATAADTVTWAQADFETLLTYATEQGLRIGSVSEWARQRKMVL
jgi:hypothetical protein